jgi:hypothetical protein
VNKLRRICAGVTTIMGEIRTEYKILVHKIEVRRPFWRQRLRWEENIKVYLKGIGYDDVEWIHLA